MGAPDASAETAGAAACSPVATTYPATSADDEDGDWRFAGDASRSARAGARLSTFQEHVLRPGENHAPGDHETTSSAGGIGSAGVAGEFSVPSSRQNLHSGNLKTPGPGQDPFAPSVPAGLA